MTIEELIVAEYWYHNISLMLESSITLMHLNVNFMLINFYFLLYLYVRAYYIYLIASLGNDEDSLVLRS